LELTLWARLASSAPRSLRLMLGSIHSYIEEGLRLLEKVYPEARVAIFPSGGLIVPITAWER
jgi:hypothetical protein